MSYLGTIPRTKRWDETYDKLESDVRFMAAASDEVVSGIKTFTAQPVGITKASVGLSAVDNTSDVNKPISSATQTALNGKANNATTLAGYNISDALTATQINTSLDLKVTKDSATGAAYMPSGTTAQRPANPSNGYMRYNTTLLSMEVYSNGEWGSVGGGDGIKATGGGTDQVFTYINKYTVTTSYTTPDNESVLTVADPLGNVNLAAGVTVTLGSNSRWVIL